MQAIYVTERGMVAYNFAKALLKEGGSRRELEEVRAELLHELHRLKNMERAVSEGVRIVAVMLGDVEKALKRL